MPGRGRSRSSRQTSGTSECKEFPMDKVIVITGASGGIGAELARQLGEKGAKLVLAARRQPELEAVAARSGREALAVVTDATRRGDVEKLRDAALQRFGR